MDILIESVNVNGHVFRTRLPRQTTTLHLMRVRASLEKSMHRGIKTMDANGFILQPEYAL
jgi:hypothetical protein